MKSERLKKTAVIAASVVVNYMVIEYFLWRPLLDFVQVPLRPELGRLAPLAQSSKAGFVPDGYVLLIGDSYAEGLGDWLMQTIGELRPRYNAAHVVQDTTGRDVLSFGFRGGYPTRNNVFETTRTYLGIQNYAFVDLGPPKDVVVLFSEHSDINDEMANIRYFLPKTFDRERLSDPAEIRAYIDSLHRDGTTASGKRWHVLRNAHLFDTFTKLVKLMVHNLSKGQSPFVGGDRPTRDHGTYQPDWSRYEDSKIKFRTADGLRPYAELTSEAFAFHSADDIRLSMLFLEESLRFLLDFFPNTRLWIAYVPSPLIVYQIEEKTIRLRDRVRFATSEDVGPWVEFPIKDVLHKSTMICNAVAAATRRAGAEFFDTRRHLRDQAWKKGYLHGPNDPGHLNEKGYTALAESIALSLKGGAGNKCDRLVIRNAGE